MEWVIEALPEFCVPVTFVPANLSSSSRNTLATVYGAGVSVSGGYFGKMKGPGDYDDTYRFRIVS